MSKRAAQKPKSKNYWVRTVTTDSTHPSPGLFNRSAATIARSLASKKVSPKGPASGMRMLNYFINRAGKNLDPKRRAELEKAKELLSARIARDKKQGKGGNRRENGPVRKQRRTPSKTG